MATKSRRSLYVLHFHDSLGEIRGTYLARTPKEVAAHVGGWFVPRVGGKCMSSQGVLELGVCGTIRFGHNLFHEPDETEVALGAYRKCYIVPGGFGLQIEPGKNFAEMVIRETGVTILNQKKVA